MDSSKLDLDEEEAKQKAKQYVAKMFNSSEKLQKLPQLKHNAAHILGRSNAIFKTAMKSQLNGVSIGLSQLKMANDEIKEIKTNIGKDVMIFR